MMYFIDNHIFDIVYLKLYFNVGEYNVTLLLYTDVKTKRYQSHL